MQDFKAKLITKKGLTHDVFEFIFEPETPFEFKTGQFVMLKVDETTNRAYSIASSPKDSSKFTLVIKLLDGGKGSEFLRAQKEGAELNFKGPFGHFVLDKNSKKDIVLVGTGTGIAPLKAIIEDEKDRKIKLFFGLRHVEDIFYKDYFESFPNVDFKMILSKPDETWDGPKGHVGDLLTHEDFDPQNIQLYMCGSKPMVDEVKQFFLDKGVPAEEIRHEIF